MHKMQTTDVPVCQPVSHAASLGFRVQKQPNMIEVLFGARTLRDQRNIVLRRGLIPHGEGWRKRIRCGLCQITLASCYILRYEVMPVMPENIPHLSI